MHGCTSAITWNPVAYIPVVNDPGMVARAQDVADQLADVKEVELLDRPTFMAEDIAFFNGKLGLHACNYSQSQTMMMLKYNVTVPTGDLYIL